MTSPQVKSAEPRWNADEAWSDLEVPLRDLTYMAGIARDIAYEVLDLECTRGRRKGDDEQEIIRMSKREFEQFFFAISKTHDMAEELERRYHA